MLLILAAITVVYLVSIFFDRSVHEPTHESSSTTYQEKKYYQSSASHQYEDDEVLEGIILEEKAFEESDHE